MAQQNLTKEDKICYGVLILVIIAISGYALYWVFNSGGDDDSDSGPTEIVSEGDVVQVHYTGRFEQGGKTVVFATTDEDVAEDSGEKKSKGYTEPDSFTPVDWQVLRKSEGTGVVNTVFLDLLDKKEGWSGTIEVPSTDNYGGVYSNELMITIPAQVNVPTYENMTAEEFGFHYTDVGTPEANMLLEHYIWGWETTILHVNNVTDQIMMKNQPLLNSDVGKSDSPLPWKVTVTSISEHVIVIRNHVDADLMDQKVEWSMLATYYAEVADVPLLKQEMGQLEGPGIIRSIANGITVDFNHEVCGKAVTLDVEIVSVTKGAAEPEP